MKEWEKVGEIDVDAGLCWLGDPGYILGEDRPKKSIGADWHEFCEKLEEGGFYRGDKHYAHSFPHEAGHSGLGIVVPTGDGDGTYPVYIKRNKDGQIIEVKVVFK